MREFVCYWLGFDYKLMRFRKIRRWFGPIKIVLFCGGFIDKLKILFKAGIMDKIKILLITELN